MRFVWTSWLGLKFVYWSQNTKSFGLSGTYWLHSLCFPFCLWPFYQSCTDENQSPKWRLQLYRKHRRRSSFSGLILHSQSIFSFLKWMEATFRFFFYQVFFNDLCLVSRDTNHFGFGILKKYIFQKIPQQFLKF